MASNDDLDDFFKKKDRKGNKAKKQTGLLTNNEELLKQLVIVTSATSAFRENMDAVDDDDDDQPPVKNDSNAATGYADDAPKHPKPKIPEKTKQSNEQYINIASKADGQQQDDWEEFEDVNSKYEQLRAKFAAGANGNDDDDDDYSDDENNPNNNDNNNDTTGDREQQKDKPVWKINRAQQEEQPPPSEPVTESPKVEESKPASTGAYRPPQMRGASSVTVVSGAAPQRVSKKKEPNLASTDEFPTLGATVNRK